MTIIKYIKSGKYEKNAVHLKRYFCPRQLIFFSFCAKKNVLSNAQNA